MNLTNSKVFDIETDGLKPTKIHVAVVEDAVCRNLEQFKEATDGATIIGHNAISFDHDVIRRLWGHGVPQSQVLDTLVLSRLACPSRKGGHSLEAWGETLGYPKVEHHHWDSYSPDMLHRCKEDVKLTKQVLGEVERELEGFDEQAIELEHQVAWIIAEQERNGWKLDEGAAYMLLAELKEKKFELEDTVRETFKPIPILVREVRPKTNMDGSTSRVGLQHLGPDCLSIVGGVHSKLEWQEFNLGSRQQIGLRLQRAGWQPLDFTETGQPKVDEKTLMRIKGIPEAELIADYLTIEKRIGMVQSWLEFLGDDGRVHGQVNSNGAVTGRMTHYNPNMAQVTAGSKIYGKEMRACWIARKGYKIVGTDASGLELRMLAHYMNDAAYTKEVESGDVHTANQLAAGLPDRNTAKTFIYAFLYGAGDAKIGAIVGGSRSDGRRLKQRFLQRTPALRSLVERVKRASRRGWLKGLDGRRIEVRSEHAALNTLLQGAGAVVMKVALVELYRTAKEACLDFFLVGNIHDEIQAEVREDHTEAFGKLAVAAIIRAGEILGLRCALDGEYKIGDNWSQTH